MNQNGAELAKSGESQEDNWWERFKDMLGFGVHHEDLPYYHEGLRRGGTLLTVQTDESRENEVAGIFADYNAVDIDTRAKEWSSAGWSPDKQMAIPVVEEELKIGKRLIRRGGVRVYTSVTEKPIEEPVTLREEHVEVTRRPVDRAATASDMSSVFDADRNHRDGRRAGGEQTSESCRRSRGAEGGHRTDRNRERHRAPERCGREKSFLEVLEVRLRGDSTVTPFPSLQRLMEGRTLILSFSSRITNAPLL